MAHFAELDENNVVLRVLVVPDVYEDDGENYLANILKFGGRWVQTSYNTNGGSHIRQDKAPLHKNYAGVGYIFDGIGFMPPKPYSSWVLDSDTYYWQPPVSKPQDGKHYRWEESTTSWVEIDLPELA